MLEGEDRTADPGLGLGPCVSSAHLALHRQGGTCVQKETVTLGPALAGRYLCTVSSFYSTGWWTPPCTVPTGVAASVQGGGLRRALLAAPW